MRSAVHVDPELLAEAQRLAEKRGVSVEAIIEQAVNDLIARSERGGSVARRELPTFRGTGVRPGVDLDRMANLLDVMDGDDSR